MFDIYIYIYCVVVNGTRGGRVLIPIICSD